ncbi:GGDEF domain-containing protein [Pseudomarimonas arenosa]|uniref:diguanylate cyclase n=1 Tax=Pseudomarimonas arenosa TaxID=2774145 RepID=A0AAW3ZQP9_9GAMM|nr:GGDEF domain-containing protein [Pseudomarimonas arenosa]MBD8528053.1 GGDEF domain-containing protein [Pseudomarimonas arenosa]
MLDERTIMVVAIVAQVLMALLALALRRSQREFAPGLSQWAAGLIMMSIGAAITLLNAGSLARGSLALSNAFYLSGIGLLGFGLMRFLHRQPSVQRWLLTTLAFFLGGVWLSASADQSPWRISLFMLQQGGVALLAIQAVFRHPDERGLLGARVIQAAMVLLLLAASFRAGLAMLNLTSVRLLAGSPVVWSFLGAVSLAQILTTIGLILMTGERVQRRLEQLASHDSLTGLLTRGGFNQFAQQILATAKREVKEVGFLMIDIDHFKQINDRHGHDIGDRILSAVAQRIDAGLREIDIVSRYGGEEFAVLLPSSNAEQTRAAAERLCRAVAHSRFDVGHTQLAVTVSVGFTSARPEQASVEQLYVEADQALYAAKRAGRNRVVAAGQLPGRIENGIETGQQKQS